MSVNVNWIDIVINLASVLIAFVMLYLKILKESRENKQKRYKIKDKLNKVDTEIVPSFKNLSSSVIDLTQSIRASSSNNSQSVSEELVMRALNKIQSNLTSNQPSHESSSTTLRTMPKARDFVEIDLEDMVTQSDCSLCGVTGENREITTKKDDGVNCINSSLTKPTNMLFVVYEDVVDVIVYDNTISGYEFATGAISMNKYTNKYLDMKEYKISDTIRTVISYKPIETYQISRDNLNLMFNSMSSP